MKLAYPDEQMGVPFATAGQTFPPTPQLHKLLVRYMILMSCEVPVVDATHLLTSLLRLTHLPPDNV